jgi:16S rRNA G966 N2-methylase RsmD
MDSLHFSFLKKSQTALNDRNWHITRDDVFRYLKRCSGKFDIIFADPPYALKELKEIPGIILSGNMLNKNGIFIFEHGKEYDFSSHPDFFRHVAYGSVNFSFFTKKEEEE